MDWQSAKQLRDKIRAGEINSVAATKAVFERIAKVEPTIGAFISTFEEQAIARAAEIDKRIAANEQVGQLAGVPVAIVSVGPDREETIERMDPFKRT